MSFCLRPNVCKKCGKPLTIFEGWTCLECEKAEKGPYEGYCCPNSGVKMEIADAEKRNSD